MIAGWVERQPGGIVEILKKVAFGKTPVRGIHLKQVDSLTVTLAAFRPLGASYRWPRTTAATALASPVLPIGRTGLPSLRRSPLRSEKSGASVVFAPGGSAASAGSLAGALSAWHLPSSHDGPNVQGAIFRRDAANRPPDDPRPRRTRLDHQNAGYREIDPAHTVPSGIAGLGMTA
jgi:hypothetical protein